MSVQFTDNSVQVKAAMDEAVGAFLEEAISLIQTQAEDNTPVDTGQLKGAWEHKVDESKGEAIVGNTLENAIWTEFGTGEFAYNRDGRKGGWRYKDDKGEWHFTYGKKPVRMLWNAYQTKKNAIIKQAERIFGAKFGD